MIFVTGDMHADPGRFSMENFPEQKEMTRNDYMVICGDFGLLWDCLLYTSPSPRDCS